jgi:hypothetical protein
MMIIFLSKSSFRFFSFLDKSYVSQPNPKQILSFI